VVVEMAVQVAVWQVECQHGPGCRGLGEFFRRRHRRHHYHHHYHHHHRLRGITATTAAAIAIS